MISRSLLLPKDEHFLLFGARNTGKSTLIHATFSPANTHVIDLLLPAEEERFQRHPDELIAQVKALPDNITHVVIDEVQKVPKLLDSVHYLIEHTNKYFVLTGSSARKLKQGGANLLAGRAFVYHLHPFSFDELGAAFDLDQALNYGLLPSVCRYQQPNKKIAFLQAYTRTYLKEEVWAEHLIRKLAPFQRFLEVAAQCNGKPLNYSNIARDVGVDVKSVQQYFTILEDTLLGFYLPAFRHSFRKRLSQQPKFYFFDMGVARALNRTVTVPLSPQTYGYGDLFEQFVILECMKANDYRALDYRFSYLRTHGDVEVDLLVERPGKPLLMIEIKSTHQVSAQHISNLSKLAREFGTCEAVCLSQDTHAKQYDNVLVLPWREGLQQYF